MFTPIDLSTWPRREHFQYYRSILPCGYSITVRLDVTHFTEMIRQNGLRFYPTFIWSVSHIITKHPAFRMGVDAEGNPGYYDMVNPNYTIFHEDDHTFSDLWTPHSEDFPTFYRAFEEDGKTYGDRHSIKVKEGMTPNFYCISCAPWIDFTGYSSFVSGGQPNLFPVLTYGKISEENGRKTIPFAINISHAAADGWHTAQFINDLQAFLNQASLSL